MALTGTLLPLAAARGYAGSSADTSDSGGDMSVSGRSCGAGHQSIRTVTLCRRHSPVRSSSLGFTLRGGKEYGTGFFVTAVERGSEAHCQGLMVGDQIIRVNGYPIEDATHKEVLFLIQNQSSVFLKVRSVGMIPTKESYNDALTWRIVEPDPGIAAVQSDNHSDHYRSNSDVCEEHPVLHSTDVRLVINVAPRAKLGCGICKGPDWKPGIFVQFTKENSLARSAGLRQGDQIMQCNNIVFTPFMDFSEATSVLRNNGVLELVVRKGSGLELFPGESSGYNSSASSVAGDQSPETWPNKRLSIVKEESIIDSERLSHNDSSYRNGMERRTDSDRIVPSNCNGIKSQTTEGGCTVIHVGPSLNNGSHDIGADVPSDRSKNNTKLAEICMVSKQLETTTTTVLVEVHQTEEETLNNQSDAGSCQLTNSSSACSLSSSGANSLCSAISQELQRRSERRANDKCEGVQPKVELFKCGLDKEKVEQHQQLMEEFKRAHRKMFANDVIESKPPDPVNGAVKSKDERESFRLKRQLLEEQHAANMSQERAAMTVKEKEFKLERDKQDIHEADKEISRLVRRQRGAAPPPPPLPKEDQTDNISTMCKSPVVSSAVVTPPRAPPLPPPPSPPDCPTPDYDTQSLTSEISIQAHKSPTNKSGLVVNGGKNASSDFVEMQSIESFKLTNPSVMKPKPPSTYFGHHARKAQNKSSDSSSISSRDTMKPTITIREYPNNQERKNPERFSFLPQTTDISTLQNDESITSRLQNELTQTLSRANLRANQEVAAPSTNGTGKNVVTISINAQPKQQPSSIVESNVKQNPFYLFQNDKSKSIDRLRNEITNNNTKMVSSIALNSSEQNTVNLKRSSIHFPIDSPNKGSVTFNFGKTEKPETRIVTVVQPNGILKNSPAGNVSQVHIHTAPPSNKPVQKSIKFGGITTIAQNSPEPKM